MKPNIIQAVKAIRSALLAQENKPITLQEIFNINTGDIPAAHIHYAARVMCINKDLSRVKQGTYVLTNTQKPVEDYIHAGKKKVRKPRKPRKVELKPEITFSQQLSKWEEEDNRVDWQDLCQKLQHALAASYVSEEQLEMQIKTLKDEIARRDTIIAYLESRITL